MKHLLWVTSLQVGCAGPARERSLPPATEPVAAVGVAAPAHGCAGQSLLRLPGDYQAPGPWPVGVVTVEQAGRMVEIWYPATPGSAAGARPEEYDLRRQLPAAEAKKIPDADNPLQRCDCYRDLPIDRAHGPYPLVLFFHGAGSFRTQSTELVTHWASRGMVVVAPDLPAINLRTALGDFDLGDPFAHAAAVLAAARGGEGEFHRFKPWIDSERVALVGHSFGGGVAARLRDQEGVVAILVMASGGVAPGERHVVTTVIGGSEDGVVLYSRQQRGFADSAAPVRLLGIGGAGHLAFSDLCVVGRDRGGIVAIAERHGVKVPGIVARLAMDGCRSQNLPAAESLPLLRFATAATLEESLQCDGAAAEALRGIAERFPAVIEFRERLTGEN